MKTIKIELDDETYRSLRGLYRVSKMERPNERWSDFLYGFVAQMNSFETDRLIGAADFADVNKQDPWNDKGKLQVYRRYIETGR